MKGDIRKPIDWDALRRDFRTSKFTDIELSSKYKVTREAIGRRRKREPDLWIQDLSQAIKDATDAALVTSMVTENHTQVTQTVLAMAEVNKQVLLDHRERLIGLMDMVELARGVVQAQSAKINDIKDAAILVQAVNGLSTATKNLIEKERENYKLNDAPPDVPKPGSGAVARIEIDFSDLIS